ncbi:hypothetical protein LPW26_14990 [Rhodopseudomonas sp. HC1]|uniref:hypothetical protein n=1 Tax=Rhodopseudomonas infernalis TaxID=2897386 RepID=UPI001EE78355|nr:hypothetical protein [Rhodopseudomonas infernalis]MCG6205956.1 hypothetical protein [Rhodopseudomonas infernalis]
MQHLEVSSPPATVCDRTWWSKCPSLGEKLCYLLVFAGLVVVRIPHAIVHGRFWAEEGSIFFANAWHLSWSEALLAVHTGYLNLTANAATLLASFFPLTHAPLVTGVIALLIQLVPPSLILTSRTPWTQRRWTAIAALLALALPPAAEETWLNSINSQHHLAVAVGIILALDSERTRVRFFHYAVLLLAALSAPAAWFLSPLLVLRALQERSPQRAIQTLLFLGGIAVEVTFFFEPAERTFGMPISVLGAVLLVKHILLPMLDADRATWVIDRLRSQYMLGGRPLWPLLIVVSLYGVSLLGALRRPASSPLWFLLGAGILTASYVAALGDKMGLLEYVGGGRYQLVPHALMMLALLSWTASETGLRGYFGAGLFGWIIAAQTATLLLCSAPYTSGADWKSEVAAWQRDGAHQLRIWPDGWAMALEKPPFSGSYRAY